jgi:hypothetical protein
MQATNKVDTLETLLKIPLERERHGVASAMSFFCKVAVELILMSSLFYFPYINPVND